MLKNIFNLALRARTTLDKASVSSASNQRTADFSASHAKSALQLQILAKVESDYQLAENYFKRVFPRPVVQFSLRGKSAGTAHLQTNRLRFNPVLLTENPHVFLSEVVPHEISHLLCYQLFGRVKPHGKEWQSIMTATFKVPPKTTHQLNVQSVSGQQFDYFCGCGNTTLSIRRHNRVQRGQTQYRCRRCKQTLQRI
ncbi:SprT family zinc-dependent metalloprotease [Shewanella ulleungensis]|uniref:Protein SprT n=1 Tax=Shewanella ulleungensis TaxID=2282699 RepID=A0ABQ2QQM6_9GAMM|nr:SprT family zinc-dependent metalloprotease [Shewanella ulleungensis]MCL1150556.1 SprT family zinc-dependent metalloprotease [Shewanella ulleungensis]GGP92076.1 protein SprT [Shewanella ulleungensis]